VPLRDQQVQAAHDLRAAGRSVIHMPAAIAELDLPDPVGAIERIEERYGDGLLPL
jgi:hypothetical protein